jgi:Rhodopirellula transposase DDE domain
VVSTLMTGRRASSAASTVPRWNKIEHRLFSFISRNWRAKPLVSLQVVVNLIAATITRGGRRGGTARLSPGLEPSGACGSR